MTWEKNGHGKICFFGYHEFSEKSTNVRKHDEVPFADAKVV